MVLALLMTPAEYDASEVYDSIKVRKSIIQLEITSGVKNEHCLDEDCLSGDYNRHPKKYVSKIVYCVFHHS